MDPERQANFERAFRMGIGTSHGQCHCGRIFYNWTDSIAFEDGELEELQNNPEATGVDHTLLYLDLMGRECIDVCDCWHKLAEQMVGFIDLHASEIAEFLKLEKERKQRLADEAVTL